MIYLVLTAVVLPLFLWGAGASAVLTLTASGFVWAISQIYLNLLPHLTDHSYFNPLAWQFLFSIGIFVGLQFNSASPRRRTTQISKWLVTAAWAYVIFALLYRYRSLLHLGWLPTMTNDKENLSASRLLHFLSIAFLFATYIGSNTPILSRWPATVVIRTGQCSLEIFSIGTILSVLLSLVVVLQHSSRLERVALDGVAVVLMALTALVLTQIRNSRRRAPNTTQGRLLYLDGLERSLGRHPRHPVSCFPPLGFCVAIGAIRMPPKSPTRHMARVHFRDCP